MLKILIVSIPILFVLGSILHFAYDFTNKNKLVGLLTPVNESIFEHSKLLLFPLILFWTTLYFFVNENVSVNGYFLAMLISIVSSIIVMIAFYYTYEGILGHNYLLIDIFDLLFSLITGQIVANHFYTYCNSFPYYLSITMVGLIFIASIYLTLNPIKIPLFFDKKSKSYGIKEEK